MPARIRCRRWTSLRSRAGSCARSRRGCAAAESARAACRDRPRGRYRVPLRRCTVGDSFIAAAHRIGYTIFNVYPAGERSMRVSKWGNSLAVRLPALVVETLGLEDGDEIQIAVAGSRTFEIAKAPGR